LSPRLARRGLRAFIAGMQDPTRLAAYARVATWSRRSVHGDVPQAELLEQALRRAEGRDEDALQVLDLEEGDDVAIPSDEFEHLDAERAHRLGPVLRLRRDILRGPPGSGRVTWSAQYAEPNLRFPSPPHDRWGHGTAASAAEARLIARAEAMERYAPGDVARLPLVRAVEADLEGAVATPALYRMSSRQYADHPEMGAFDPEAAYLWTPAQALDGSRRWVPAETVFYPFVDPERSSQLAFGTSSGVAAHTRREEAVSAAFHELIERDAFMWMWVQRVSRERIQTRGLPDDTTALIGLMERAGYRVDLINLTLDTCPVILCVVRSRSSLQLGVVCRRDPVTAAARAVDEAARTVAPEPPESPTTMPPQTVARLEDHEGLHQREEMLEQDAFLFSSPDEIDIHEVTAPQDPLEELLSPIGESLTIDLSSPASRPFRVARAIVPNLVPVTFGWDREPLGMPRLLEPKTTLDGRGLGSFLNLDSAPPIIPHPFS
jgi:ribosomal protein S12 methylthiotransferase accessory factor